MTRRSMDKDTLNEDLLLSLPMREATGTATTQDVAKPHHPITLVHAPVWTQITSALYVLDFNSGDPDYIECPAADSADLNFTSGDFSAVVWTYAHTFAATHLLFSRRSYNTDGWCFGYNIGYGLYAGTYQAGDNQSSRGYFNPTNQWVLAGLSRQGTSIRVFSWGRDITSTAESHTDPVTANRDLVIGADSNHTSPFDGYLWNPRIWGRALTPQEHMSIFQRERHWFGV